MTKKYPLACPKCKLRTGVKIEDSRGSIAALAFMHEYSVGKPERDVETVDMTKRLEDMTERERESLRAQLYAKSGDVSVETKVLVERARAQSQLAGYCSGFTESARVLAAGKAMRK